MLFVTFTIGTKFFQQAWIGFVAYNKAIEDLLVAIRRTKIPGEIEVDKKSCKYVINGCMKPPGLYIDTLENLPISDDAMKRIQQLSESATDSTTLLSTEVSLVTTTPQARRWTSRTPFTTVTICSRCGSRSQLLSQPLVPP
jgi:hypothetical protein